VTRSAQIVSGLRNFVSLDDMRGRRVVVLANLKPAKL
jgi:tRNA-binding EMAP/Myf-like protein